MYRHYASIGSTNEVAKAWACDVSTPAPHGAVVSADAQTHGRGRHGRDWISPLGKGVYLSMILRPQEDEVQVGRLTIVAALATVHVAEQFVSCRAQTKWPNDVLLDEKKIGGVLCEAGIENGCVAWLIAGIGLNLNFDSSDLPSRPIFPATSLYLETGQRFDVKSAREELIVALHEEYARYEGGGWSAQREEFWSRCVLQDKVVSIRGTGQEYSGVATGLDQNGLLMVQTRNSVRAVAAGDVFLN